MSATSSISIVTATLLVYISCTVLPVPFAIVFWLFLLTTAGLFWMVYKILTDTTNLSGKTFDEYFYEDSDYRRS